MYLNYIFVGCPWKSLKVAETNSKRHTIEGTLFGLHVKHNESSKGLIYCSQDPLNQGTLWSYSRLKGLFSSYFHLFENVIIVKSCTVPALTSEKCWSPGPKPVKLGTSKKLFMYSFKMFFTSLHRLIFHVKLTLTKFWSLTSLMSKEAKTKKKRKVTFFRCCCLVCLFYLFIYLFIVSHYLD